MLLSSVETLAAIGNPVKAIGDRPMAMTWDDQSEVGHKKYRYPGFSLHGVPRLGDEPLRPFVIVRGCRKATRYLPASATRVVPTVLPVRSRLLRARVSSLHFGGIVLPSAVRAESRPCLSRIPS